MPFDGEKFDELLSGYLDDQLTEAERSEVQLALRSTPELRHRLDDDLRIGSEIKRLRDAAGTRQLPSNFSAKVLAEAQRQARAAGLADSHHVLRATGPDRSTERPRSRPAWRLPVGVLSSIAALAAMLLMAVYLPNWFNGGSVAENAAIQNSLAHDKPPQESQEIPETLPPVGPATVRYVGDANFRIMYMLLVDMEVSSDALARDYLSAVFANSGIALRPPLVATKELRESLADARMTVHAEDETAGDANIYFVHAETAAVGRLLQTLYDDLQNVPTFRMDVSFDAPSINLMQQIAEISGQRFAVNESIAAPLSADADADARVSPFSGISPQGQLISSGKRRRLGEQDAGSNLVPLDEGQSSCLILVRLPR